MFESAIYPSCRFCDLSADTHCMSCGGNLGEAEEYKDTNDALLALMTQVNTFVAGKTRGILGAHRELKMSIATGALCTMWMFGCLIIVNMQSFGSSIFDGDTTVAVQSIDQHGVDVLEPSLQAAVEGK